MRLIYSLLLYLCVPLVFGYFLFRAPREPGYLHGWGQRLGFGLPRSDGCLWVHAASLGEVGAAAPLVQALRERWPQHSILVTAFTPTGRARAAELFGSVAQVAYAPLDVPGAVRRFVRAMQPRLLVIVETEIWPNLIHACTERAVPVMLANARLSDKSVRRYGHPALRGLFVGAFSRLAAVAAASQADGERFRAVGASPDNIQVTGNLKFDLQIPVGLAQRGRALRDQWQAGARPVWIAASTHAGEEEIVLDAWVCLRERHPDLLLVLVPRHPQRFAAVADLLARRGMTCAKRSVGDAVDGATQVLLGDTLGELLLLFAAADLAFVGGSLVPAIGGHNLLEPAALALPLTTGPHLGGWGEVAGWLEQAGALRRIRDSASLAEATGYHIVDADAGRRAGKAGAQVVASHRGAVECSLALLAPLLGD